MTGHAQLHFTACADTPVEIANRTMVVVGDRHHGVTLSDGDGPERVADLIARMFETLASAPDLTEHERAMVRGRMLIAMESVKPIPYTLTCRALFDYEGDTGMGVLCTLPAGHTEPHKADDLPSATKIPYLPADRGGETDWQQVEAGAESIGGAA